MALACIGIATTPRAMMAGAKAAGIQRLVFFMNYSLDIFYKSMF
jgi:hypothetical protein